MSNELPRGRGPNTVYDFDTYWTQLVTRVHGGEPLEGQEHVFYRLSSIRGELYDDAAKYFEEEFAHFDDDLRVLDETGFGDISNELRNLRAELFGDAPLTKQLIDAFLDAYYEDEEGESEMHERLEGFNDTLRPRLDDLQDYRDQLGLSEAFYRKLEW
jgi:hypothetical protein